MSRIEVADGAVSRIDLGEDQGDEAIAGAALEDVLVQTVEEFRREFRPHAFSAQPAVVDEQPQRRVQGRDQERGRHPLARDVRDHQSAARPGEAKRTVVVAADLARGTAPANRLEAARARHLRGQDVALDLGGELHLALEALLLERLPMELRVGQRDRGLVGEQRERPMIGRGERADSGPALLVRDHEQADAAAAPVAFDGDRERVFRGRHHARRYRFDAGFVETGRRRFDRLAGAAADRAGEREAAFVVQQVEGAAPGVQERNRAQQDLLGQFVQVQRRSDRQPHVVDRLQRDDVVVVLELPVLQLVGQFPQPEADGQHSGEVVLLRRAPLSAAGAVIASRIVDGRVVEDQAVLQAPFAGAEDAP